MGKLNKERLKSDKGFTMIELIIVIAILGILAAILVPSFTQMTRKSRLKADISTVRQFQTQIDLYVADHDGQYPTSDGKEPTSSITGKDVAVKLIEGEYIKASEFEDISVDSSGKATLGANAKLATQTQDLSVKWNDTTSHMDLTFGTESGKVYDLTEKLSDKEREWISNPKSKAKNDTGNTGGGA